MCFFTVIYEACGEGCTGEDILKENIDLLTKSIAEVDGNENEDDGKASGPFGALKGVFKKLLPTLTGGGKNSLLPKEAQKIFKGVMEGDTLDSVGDMFSEISGSIEKGAAEANEAGKKSTGASITTMLDNISSTLKSESVVGKLEGIANKLSDLSSGLLAPPTGPVETAKESTEDNNADDQD